MKKTLQINIGGIAFTIEEDAFQTLNNYLEAIKKYFSTYEGSKEITEDIENRIAEKLFKKTSTSGIIEMNDVDQIIKSMGSVSDFQAFDEEEEFIKLKTSETNQNEVPKNETKPKTNFFRNGKKKIIAGVLSGLSNKYEIDEVWLRAAFIILTIGLIGTGSGFVFIIAYLVCWISFPESNELEENEKVKKFYRDTEHKVLGGVSTGLASYLGIDLVLVRIVFVLTAFIGIGFLIYFIIWIVAPKATSLTQKMELKGEALTIENIETSIKAKNYNTQPAKESLLTQLLLLPFRFIGMVLQAIGKLLKPIGFLFKILIGLFLLIIGAILCFTILVLTGLFLGSANYIPLNPGIEFIEIFTRDFPVFGGFFAFLVTFIPAAALTIGGLILITGQGRGSRNFWFTSLALWFAGVVGSGILVSQYMINFSETNNFTEEVNLVIPSQVIYLDATHRRSKNEDNFRFDVDINLETSESDKIILVKNFIAKGNTEDIALENAKKIAYEVFQKDSILLFPRNLKLSGIKTFRDQAVENTLKIPKNRKFRMTRQFASELLDNYHEILDDYAIDYENIDKFTFSMGDNNKIICNDCPVLTAEEKQNIQSNRYNDNEIIDNSKFNSEGEFKKTFDSKDFENINLSGSFIATVKYGSEFKVEAFCNDKKELDRLNAKIKSGTLSFEFEDPFENKSEDVIIKITCPNLKSLNVSGASEIKSFGFENQQKFELTVSGASRAAIEIKSIETDINVSGASKIICSGETKNLNLELSGSSEIDCRKLKTESASINASGASTAKIGKIKNIKSQTSGGSEIEKE